MVPYCSTKQCALAEEITAFHDLYGVLLPPGTHFSESCAHGLSLEKTHKQQTSKTLGAQKLLRIFCMHLYRGMARLTVPRLLSSSTRTFEVSDFALSDLLDEQWSHVSSLLPVRLIAPS